MARVRGLVGAAMTSILVVACNLLSGVGDLEIADNDASTPFGDGGGPGLGDGNSNHVDGSSSGNPVDGQTPVDTGPPPTCPSAGHTCAKAPPSGWDGPFMVYVGDKATAPTCPTEMPTTDDGPTGNSTGGEFTCECKCGGVTGAVCTPFLDEFSDGTCVTPVGRVDLNNCRAPGAGTGFKASVDLTTTGSCPSSGAFKSKVDLTFNSILRLCHRPSQFLADGCNADELCVPESAAPFKTKSCIGNSDPSQSCPAPWTDSYRLYGGVNDTRACNKGTCDCDVPSGTNCLGGKVKNATSSTTCQGPGQTLAIPLTNCITVGASASQKVEVSPTPTGGSCNPIGAPAPAGDVTGNGGSIVCCTP